MAFHQSVRQRALCSGGSTKEPAWLVGFFVLALRRCFIGVPLCSSNKKKGANERGVEREEKVRGVEVCWGWHQGGCGRSWETDNAPLCARLGGWWCHGWQNPKPTELVKAWHAWGTEECCWHCSIESGGDREHLFIPQQDRQPDKTQQISILTSVPLYSWVMTLFLWVRKRFWFDDCRW